MTDSARRSLSPLVFLFITVTIEVMGSSLLFPAIPFVVQQFRDDAVTIGLLSSSFAIAQFLAAPFLGTLSDRVGRRPVLLACALGTSISFFIFGFANTLWLLFASQIVNGLTGGVVSTAQAYIADVSKSPQDRTKNFGLLGAAAGLGFIFGPALGGVLASIALKLPAFVAGGIALGNTLLGYFTLPESLKTKRTEPIAAADLNPIKQLGTLFAKPQLRYLLIGYFIFFLAFTGFTNNFSVYVRDRFDWGPPNIAGILLVVGIVSSVVQGGLIRKLLPRFGEMRLAIAGLTSIAVALVLVALAPVGWYLYLTQILFALGVGITSPPLRGLIANAVKDSEQGIASGGSQSLGSLTQILGPFLAGLLYDNLGRTVPIWTGAGLVLVAIAAIVQNRQVSKKLSAVP